MLRSFLAMSCMLAASSAFAQDLASCSKIADSLQRLTCYDDLAKSAAPKAPETPKPAPTPSVSEALAEAKAWEVTESKSPVDDKLQITASIPSEEMSSILVLRCRDNRTDLFVGTDKYLGSDDFISITYRIGSEKAISTRWNGSTTGRAVFVPKAIAFSRQLPDDVKLFVRIEAYRSAPVDATFPLGKFSDIRAKVASACGW